MNHPEDDQNDVRELRELLKKSVPRVHAELRRDLWPEMLQRLDSRTTRVPWFDWALAAAAAALLLLFPQAIPALLYHL
ncbi:MAG TPA: hypothetical protein VLY23_02100 [Candidatus Acidoferrum sp.]|nr:hypothetical protein [Candidatus Acidoferrum sp.]